MTARIFDDRPCLLGEGPLWHPKLGQLFWFDIVANKLVTRKEDKTREWQFDESVSAAGWIDDNRLLVASASGLWDFDLRHETRERVCALEDDNLATRSNDGRADPFGGFWIGTMGRNAEPGAGAIYRYHRGDTRRLFSGITVSNAICFAPDRTTAYFADTATGRVMRVALDPDGWPAEDPAVFVDLSGEGLNPDGAVTDADGTVWIAQWGAARVAGYGPDGRFVRDAALPARHVTCPAFGGEDLTTLYVTSATQGLDAEVIAEAPSQGMTFAIADFARGLPEPRVCL